MLGLRVARRINLCPGPECGRENDQIKRATDEPKQQLPLTRPNQPDNRFVVRFLVIRNKLQYLLAAFRLRSAPSALPPTYLPHSLYDWSESRYASYGTCNGESSSHDSSRSSLLTNCYSTGSIGLGTLVTQHKCCQQPIVGGVASRALQ